MEDNIDIFKNLKKLPKDELELVFPTKEHQKQIEEYLQEFLDNGENEIYVENEIVQRYWISLKKRFVTNPNNMEIVENGNLKIKAFNNLDFTGDIALIKFNKMYKPYVVENINLCMANNNYKWLEFYDYSKKYRLTAMYNDKNKIIEWYFDIARKIGKENGMPYEDDLYLDVVVTQKGDIILLDEDELKVAFEKMEVTKKEYDEAYQEARKLIDKLKGEKDSLQKFTDKYLKIMLGDE